MTALHGAIEAGGTKFICAVGNMRGSRSKAVIPTRDPDATFADVAAFFAAAALHGPLEAFGLASFGPIRLDPDAPDYGTILHTPKAHWEGVDMIARLGAIADVPIGVDTDVNAAARAEADAAGLRDLAYVTVGTGIGVGILSGGQTVRGAGHPEGGHVPVRRHPDHGEFAGVCPFHGDCLEGLASGPALSAAWGAAPDKLPPRHPAWAIEADYLAQLCTTLILTVAPRRIVVGGGVMQHHALLPLIRARTSELLGGYVAGLDDGAAIAALIVAPLCVEPSGLVGAYLLAADAAQLTAKQ